jgi:hypothetical protein
MVTTGRHPKPFTPTSNPPPSLTRNRQAAAISSIFDELA